MVGMSRSLRQEFSSKLLKYPVKDPQRCPLYLKLPWACGNVFQFWKTNQIWNWTLFFDCLIAKYILDYTNSSFRYRKIFHMLLITKQNSISINVPMRLSVLGLDSVDIQGLQGRIHQPALQINHNKIKNKKGFSQYKNIPSNHCLVTLEISYYQLYFSRSNDFSIREPHENFRDF